MNQELNTVTQNIRQANTSTEIDTSDFQPQLPGHWPVSFAGITVEQAVALLSTRPAEIAGLTEHGRPIAAGSPANLAIIDPAHRWTVHGDALASRSNNTPWEGREFSARVRHTVLRGNPVVTEFELTD